MQSLRSGMLSWLCCQLSAAGTAPVSSLVLQAPPVSSHGLQKAWQAKRHSCHMHKQPQVTGHDMIS
jgi:hypothetical protein